MLKPTLRLFNAIQVDPKLSQSSMKLNKKLTERTIKHGYIIGGDIIPSTEVLEAIESVVGISGEKANASFHKSWSTIINTPLEVLVIQQIMHYITTYGFENLGVYSEKTVYIPNEVLEIPEIEEDIPLVVIHSLTAEEILEKIIELGNSGIALHQETLDDIMVIVEHNKYSAKFVDKIKNRELKVLLQDFYQIVPSNPTEYLRYVISKLTNESLIIKNNYLIDKIKSSNGKFLDELLKQAPPDLASIFFRFKPLFLAMKSISRNKRFFNQLRRKAKVLHKPLPENYINSVTGRIKNDKFLIGRLRRKLKTTNIFNKIKLAYALKYRINNPPDSIVYRIRNGKGWVTDFDYPNKEGEIHEALNCIINSIAKDISQNVKNKVFYIPKNINYALPATEKQFTGFFPTGTSVEVNKDMIIGIHWLNVGRRIDLDLSLVNISGKVGWDADYYSYEKSIIFSGDVTDAPPPNGASELFYLKRGVEKSILNVNYYNYNENYPVPTKVFVASEEVKNIRRNYMVNPNNIIASTNITINRHQNILGIVEKNKFYFANVNIGRSITARSDGRSIQVLDYFSRKTKDIISLEDIISLAGGIIMKEKIGKEYNYIDLSPNAIDKNSIINLLT